MLIAGRAGGSADCSHARASAASASSSDPVPNAYAAGKEAAELGERVNPAEWHEALLAYGQAANELGAFEEAYHAYRQMAGLLDGDRAAQLAADCDLGLADSLVHLADAAVAAMKAAADGYSPWAQAHAAAVACRRPRCHRRRTS